jgi:hypothetical protein
VDPKQIGELTELNDLQATWREKWARDFAAYLEKQGKPEHVSGEWPLKTFVPAPACLAEQTS